MMKFLKYSRLPLLIWSLSTGIYSNCLSLPKVASSTLRNPYIKLCKPKTPKHKPNNMLNGLFNWYQKYISSQDGAVCQFKTTCSLYMKNSLQKKGFFAGIIIGFERLLRDHPFISLNPTPYNKAKD